MAGILIRFGMALVLVFATWNPTGWSFVHWFLRTLPDVTAPLVFAGVVLLIGWILFLHATLASLGILGILLAGAFFGSLTWLLFDLGRGPSLRRPRFIRSRLGSDAVASG